MMEGANNKIVNDKSSNIFDLFNKDLESSDINSTTDK